MLLRYASTTDLEVLINNSLSVEGTVVALPFTKADEARQAATLMSSRANSPGLILAVEDLNAIGFIAIVNLIFKATRSTYFAYVAQDSFAGRDWLKMAVEAMGDEKVLLGFNDGKWAGALAGFGLARRSWAASNYGGDFFCTSYHRHFADAELTLLALQVGSYAYEPNCVLIEVDWEKDKATVERGDRLIFLSRKKNGFGGKVTSPVLLNLIS